MGSNNQKVKQNGADGKRENQQLIDVNEKDLKQNANLGTSRWFYNTQYISWELYNSLNEEEKEKSVFWIIFPLETSNEIERAYINKFPYEKAGKMIFFDYLQQKHVLLCNQDNSLNHLGIVKRASPNAKSKIKKESHFNLKNNYLYLLDNKVNTYQYQLLNNLALICYETIFFFFDCEMVEDKLIRKFLSTTIICSQKFYVFLNTEYQEYIKTNFTKYKTSPFSLLTLKNMLLFDFKNEPIYLNYFLNNMEEKDFDVIIMNMFLEASAFGNQILEFTSNCSKKNVEYTTYYLCLLYILITLKDKNKNISLWENENESDDGNEVKKEEKEENNNDTNNSNNNSRKNSSNNNSEVEEKEVRTYIYLNNNQMSQFYENDYFYCKNFLLTSKNKFNNILQYDIESKKKFMEIEIRIPKRNYISNLHPIFNLDEYNIERYSLYNEQNIIFPSNSVFKCLNVDRKNKKIIVEFIRDVVLNPLSYLTRENKKLFGIYEEGFRYLTEEQRRQVIIARVKNREVKYIYGLANLRELEIFDDAEPKTDISVLTGFFNQFKKLKCLTIVGNNMGNKDCAALSNGLKSLKELKVLNLSFNCLNDSNFSKICFNNNNKIEILNLKSNSATEISMESFKEELKKCTNLKELNMLDNQFGDQGFGHLLQIFDSIKKLCVLILSNCNISNAGIQNFAEILKKNENFKKMEILNLISNPMNDDCLPNLLYIIKNLPSLKKFSIAQTQISPSGLNLIFKTLKGLNQNWIFDENGGWFALIEKDIKEERNFRNIIRENETPVVFNTLRVSWLRKNRKKLENKIHFDFTNCNIKSNNIIFDLEKELSYFTNLKIINFSYNHNISPVGYEALSKGLQKLHNLSSLILCSNDITDKSLEYICNIFDECKNLAVIDLSINNITFVGFANFIINLTKNNIDLREMDFYNNEIGDDGFKILCESAKNESFNSLQKLNFGKNNLGNDSMKYFSETFLKFIHLEHVIFTENNFTDDIVLIYSPLLNDLVDNIRIIDITKNKISEGMKCLFRDSGLPLNIIY